MSELSAIYVVKIINKMPIIHKRVALSQKIVSFLKERPAISVKSIERDIGIPNTTINGAMSGKRNIPDRHIDKIILFLKKYGFE